MRTGMRVCVCEKECEAETHGLLISSSEWVGICWFSATFASKLLDVLILCCQLELSSETVVVLLWSLQEAPDLEAKMTQ